MALNGLAPRARFELATLRLTDFQDKIQVLSLVSLTAQGSLQNFPQLSVIVRKIQVGGKRESKFASISELVRRIPLSSARGAQKMVASRYNLCQSHANVRN
jgi:hypothetical protein